MAGHSAWKNIKHRKAAVDAKRGKAWSKCARAIIVAARTGGGSPDSNFALRAAIDEARAVNMPRDTIEKAVKKGTGELASETYDSVIYEGYGPRGVAVMLEILTDNRNRTSPEIKLIFEKYGGNLGPSNCVAYQFQQRGLITVNKSADEDALLSAALDAGALDVTKNPDHYRVLTQPTDFVKIRKALESAKFTIDSSELTRIPNTTVTVTGVHDGDAQKVLALIEALDDHDDVQKVHANFEIPDEELSGIK